MKRVASIWFPMLSIDVLHRHDLRSGRARDDRAILLISSERQRQMVAHRCQHAASANVRIGMPLSEARALLPCDAVRVETAAPQRDAAALRALGNWAHRFTPYVAIDPPNGLLLDLTGCARIFRGEHRLLDMLSDSLKRLGFSSRSAIASTIGCAWAVAHYGDDTSAIIADGEEQAAISPLPVAAMRLDEDTKIGLMALGVDRVEHLLTIPRVALSSRFGSDVLLRIDQAFGRAIETIDPIRPTQPLRIERVFDGPTTQWEALKWTVRDLLSALTDELRIKESGVSCLVIDLIRPGTSPEQITVTFSHPTRNARHLWSLVYPKLEHINLGFGVEEIYITAQRYERLPHQQSEQWRKDESASEASVKRSLCETIDTLINRLGDDRVYRACSIASYLPERRFRRQSTATEPQPPRQSRHGEAIPMWDRPTLLLPKPVPIDVVLMSPDGPVLYLRRRAGEQRIVSTIGPERISSEWWRRTEPTRDYFKLQESNGTWLWCYRQLEANRWFIHGVWG